MGTRLSLIVLLGLTLAIVACGAGPEDGAASADTGAPTETAADDPATAPEPGVVEITAEEFAFTAPPTFPSGWVRLRFENRGEEPHFLLLWDLPDGHTFEEYAEQVSMPFQDLYSQYRAGELDQQTFLDDLVAALPDWFYEAVPRGGPGFTSPGQTSEVMVYLEPGDNYVLECYVRSGEQDDRFHGSEGMLRPLIVTEEATGLEPPTADIHITLSSFELAVEGELSAGEHVAAVHVADVPEGFIRHNVHLARLAEGQTGTDLVPWLDWVEQMVPPAPAVFLGGAGQAETGATTYFRFHLEPGQYAWVSELHGSTQGMVHDFTVE